MTVRLFNRLLAIALLIIAFASCSDSVKEDLEPNVPTEFTPSNESTIYFASGAEFAGNGGDLTITFTCNKKWKAISTKDWCKITPQNGSSGNNSIIINVEANPTLEKRDAVVTIVVEGQNSYITVRQIGSETGKVHVDKAGDLPSLLNGDITKIKELTVSGQLNGTDFKVLRAMSNYLIKLDMSEVRIVEGGDSYFYDANQKHYTKNDIFPYWGMGYFTKLKEIILPTTLDQIDGYAFIGCSELKNIDISQTVKYIGDAAFYGCASLDSICVPQQVTVIPTSAFYNCSNLKQIDLPEKLDSIGTMAFGGCKSLSEIKLNEGLRIIEINAFYDCSALKDINIPQTVDYIGISAFSGCSSLEKLTIHKGVEDCHSIFLSSNGYCGLKKLTVHFNNFPMMFLNDCINLEELILENGLEVFKGVTNLEETPNLKELVIPSTIREMDLGKNSLLQLHVKTENPPITGSWFKEYCENCTLYIPKGCKDAYINAGNPWTLFKDIIEE